MQKIIYICVATIFLLLAGCEEAKRYEIISGDDTPPGEPIFVESEPLPGGAKVFFMPPNDHDILYIEASYQHATGKVLRFAASFAAGYVDVYGFDSAGEYPIILCAVDRAGNRSKNIHCSVETLDPEILMLAKSLEVLSSFSSILFKWENESEEPLYVWVNISYMQNGMHKQHTAVFNTYQTELRTIDDLNLIANEQVSVSVDVRDRYDNVVQAKDTSIVLLVDELLSKDNWIIPDRETEMDGIIQVNGTRIETVIDEVIDIDVENYFITIQDNPWSIIIDLGEEYEISRILTHQRWTGYNESAGVTVVRGNLYRGYNILASNLYGWDEASQSWKFWSRRQIIPPVVTNDGGYTLLGRTGDLSYIYPSEPKFSEPTRFIRMEAINGKYISEITLYGRKAQ